MRDGMERTRRRFAESKTAFRAFGLGLAAVLAAAVALGSTIGAGPAFAVSGNERLAGDLELLTLQQVQANKIVPEHDQKRTAKCLAMAIAADIPEPDAAKLSEIFEGRSKADPALQKKWFTISKKDAPARNAQVMGAVDKLCKDLGPYIAPMM